MPAAPAYASPAAGRHSSGDGRHSRRARRILLALGLTLMLVASLATTGGIVLLRRYDSAVGTASLLDPGARADQGSEHATITGPLNFLLIGSDLRVSNPNAGQRSDTMIIAHVTRNLDRVYLVSIPRDLLVDIPAVPARNFYGQRTKINAAFDFGGGGPGGVQLLSQTLTALTGIRFDGAAVIEFSGLRRAVDVLGGVNMCLDAKVTSIHTGKVFTPGCRLMNSADVLDFLRQRYGVEEGDFGRQKHQQQFLKSFLSRAMSAGLVSNPIKLDTLLRAVGSALTLDTGDYSLADLAFGLRNISPNNLTGIKVPTYYDMWGDQSVVVPTEEATSLFTAVRQDKLESWVRGHKQWVNAI